LIGEESKNKAEAARRAKEIDENYRAAIVKADDAMATKNLTDARKGYEDALGIKPDEAYPKNKIAAIDRQIEDARLAGEAEAKAKSDADAAAKAKAAEDARLKAEAEAKARSDAENKARAVAEAKRKADEEAARLKAEADAKANADAEVKRKAEKEAAAKAKAEADAKAKAEAGRKAEALKKLRSEREQARLADIEKVKADKVKLDADASERARVVRQMRQEAHKGLTEEERHRYLGELALEYPPGLTEESYMDGNKKILMRIVVADGHATTFKKVIQPWGQTFWFKNGLNTTKYLWESESDPD